MAMKERIKRNLNTVKYVFYRETLIDFKDFLWTFIGAFTGIALIGFFQQSMFSSIDNLFLIGSFGATSVLVYAVPNSPLAQPRNLLGGHLLSAMVGVSVQKFCPDIIWLSAALAVSLSILVMQITKTLHPPGGATALIAVIGSEKIKALGYLYVINPVLIGVMILFITALISNNIPKGRRYPVNQKWINKFFRKSVKPENT